MNTTMQNNNNNNNKTVYLTSIQTLAVKCTDIQIIN